jgi:hypothetical protein
MTVMQIISVIAEFFLAPVTAFAVYTASKIPHKRRVSQVLFALLLIVALPMPFFINRGFSAFAFPDSFAHVVANLYHFAVLTWGVGILGLCLFVKGLAEYDKPPRDETDGKLNFRTFSLFAVLPIVLGIFFSDTFALETAVPLMLFTTICGIFAKGLNLRIILTATTALGVIFSAQFLLTSEPVTGAQLTNVSLMFSFMSLLIVLVSCGGRFRTQMVTAAIATVTLFFAVRSVINI